MRNNADIEKLNNHGWTQTGYSSRIFTSPNSDIDHARMFFERNKYNLYGGVFKYEGVWFETVEEALSYYELMVN